MSQPNRVLVTGGTRGIGKATAEVFLQKGWEVIITGTSTTSPEIEWSVGRPEYWQANLEHEQGIQDVVDRVRSLDAITAVVNNAGINIISPVEDVGVDDYDKINRVNVKAPYFIAQGAAEVMMKNQGGFIVNIASIWSVITKSQRSLYSSAKAGLAGMTRAMAVEFAPHNILVNAISPGFIDTELTRASLSEQQLEHLVEQVPLGKLGEGSDIGNLAHYLCSKENSFITGQNLVIDGGFTIV